VKRREPPHPPAAFRAMSPPPTAIGAVTGTEPPGSALPAMTDVPNGASPSDVGANGRASRFVRPEQAA